MQRAKNMTKRRLKTLETSQNLTRNNIKLNDKIRLYAHQTRTQRTYWKHLSDELLRRVQEGETDLFIKYFNGMYINIYIYQK